MKVPQRFMCNSFVLIPAHNAVMGPSKLRKEKKLQSANVAAAQMIEQRSHAARTPGQQLPWVSVTVHRRNSADRLILCPAARQVARQPASSVSKTSARVSATVASERPSSGHLYITLSIAMSHELFPPRHYRNSCSLVSDSVRHTSSIIVHSDFFPLCTWLSWTPKNNVQVIVVW